MAARHLTFIDLLSDVRAGLDNADPVVDFTDHDPHRRLHAEVGKDVPPR
jgi:hypothetical protein